MITLSPRSSWIGVDLHQVHMNYQMEGCSTAQDCASAAGECTLDQHVLLATHDITGESPRMNQIICDIETKCRTLRAMSKQLLLVRGSTAGVHLLDNRCECGDFLLQLAHEIETLPPMDLNIMDPMLYAESLETLAKELSGPVSISSHVLKMFIPFLLLLASDILDI